MSTWVVFSHRDEKYKASALFNYRFSFPPEKDEEKIILIGEGEKENVLDASTLSL